MKLLRDLLAAIINLTAALDRHGAAINRPQWVNCDACLGTGNSKNGLDARRTTYDSPCFWCDGKGKRQEFPPPPENCGI